MLKTLIILKSISATERQHLQELHPTTQIIEQVLHLAEPLRPQVLAMLHRVEGDEAPYDKTKWKEALQHTQFLFPRERAVRQAVGLVVQQKTNLERIEPREYGFYVEPITIQVA